MLLLFFYSTVDTRCVRLSYVNQRMVLPYHLLPLFNQNVFWYEITALILKAEQLRRLFNSVSTY
jgi:hypothetical protein